MKRSSRNKPEILTRSTRTKIMSKFLILTMAYLMEETEYNDPEKLFEMYIHLQSWLEKVEDHIISINKIKSIVEEKTGRKIIW